MFQIEVSATASHVFTEVFHGFPYSRSLLLLGAVQSKQVPSSLNKPQINTEDTTTHESSMNRSRVEMLAPEQYAARLLQFAEHLS
jgi:hypothetical protein